MVELGLSPDGRWQASAADIVVAAAGAGFDAVGIDGLKVDDGADALCRSGLRCHELAALLVGDDDEAAVRSAEALAAAAERVRAEWVLTVFTSPPTDATAAVLQRCAALLGEVGAGLAVEFSLLSEVRTIGEGLAMVQRARAGGRSGLIVDAWHFSFGSDTWDDLAALRTEDIAYVQFTDALPPNDASLMRETMHRRTTPGDGILELDRFTSTLLDLGFDGTVSAEVLNADLRSIPLEDAVRRIHAGMASYWC